jgi:hypothetical protein
MQNEKRAMMVAPSAGFTNRVMARIDAHERAQAQRRAWIGIILLTMFVMGVFALAAFWIFSWIVSIVTTPSTIAPIVLAVSSLVGDSGSLMQATWGAVMAIARNVSEGSLIVYALIVLAMTALWAYVASGSFQFSLSHIRVGGSK